MKRILAFTGLAVLLAGCSTAHYDRGGVSDLHLYGPDSGGMYRYDPAEVRPGLNEALLREGPGLPDAETGLGAGSP